MAKKKRFTAGSVITTASFLTLVLGFALAGILSPDRDFSEMENRTLQKFPEFTFERLKNGEFTADIEQYMSDQIFLKDELVSLKTTADRTLMKTYLNGVYFADDGFYIQDFQENDALIEKNIGLLNDFAETVKGQAEVSFLLAPNASYVLEDKLPEFTQTDSQRDTVNKIQSMMSADINFVCPAEDMFNSPDKESFYYRTDHHWTDFGAQQGFKALMDKTGDMPSELPSEAEELNGFYGTLYSKAPRSGVKPDTIRLVSDPDSDITVKYVSQSGDHKPPAECESVDGVPTKKGLFADEPKAAKDKYASIMGGNFALLELESGGGRLDENVLVIKDSYANAVMPYLCQAYKHISVIDLRYYHMEELTVSEYVRANGITKVIYVYNVDFINSDNNFVWLE